jgi:hypothetical protein
MALNSLSLAEIKAISFLDSTKSSYLPKLPGSTSFLLSFIFPKVHADIIVQLGYYEPMISVCLQIDGVSVLYVIIESSYDKVHARKSL